MLRFPRALFLAVGLSLLLTLPALAAEFFADDVVMILRLEGLGPDRPGLFNLYRFAAGGPGESAAFMASSDLPWWAASDLKLAFLRPLASALYAFDHAVAGRHAVFYHLHSIAWYLLAVVATSALFRKLLASREAALATLLFAISPAHWMPAVWPSARHLTICETLAALALLLHISARRSAGTRPKVREAGALAITALGLLLGESALGIFAFVFAFELFHQTERTTVRARALLPWGLLFVGYAAIYKSLGYGVHGSGAYIDPIAATGPFLAALPSRLLMILASALVCLPSDVAAQVGALVPVHAAAAILASLALFGLLRRLPRLARESETRTVRFLLAGAALAVLPGLAGFPGDRVLLLPDIGVIGALAVLLLRAPLPAPGEERTPRALRISTKVFWIAHAVLGPIVFLVGTVNLAYLSRRGASVAREAELPASAETKLVGIGLADPLDSYFLRAELGFFRPEAGARKVHRIAPSRRDHLLRRTDDRTMEVTIVGGALLESIWERLFRPNDGTLREGDTVHIDGWDVRVLAAGAEGPTRFKVTFDRSADDPGLAFVRWHDGQVRRFTPPAVGQELLVGHEPGPTGM